MGSISPPQAEDINADSSSVSHFLKTVVLQDWWLIKAGVGDGDGDGDGHVSLIKSLGVAGFTSKDQAVRSFSSAPICRIYDVFTLETVDGITVLLKGFINKSRTRKNGFSAEVFKHFVFGFPPCWENYVKFLEGGSGDEDVSRTTTASEKLVTDSGGGDDFHEGTPNKKRKSVRNLKAANCDNKLLNKAIKKRSDTESKRLTSSSHRLPDANQCLDDLCESTPKSDRKAITQSKLKSCDNLDLNQAGKGSTGLDLNEKQKPAIETRVPNCDDEDLSQAGDSNNTKENSLLIRGGINEASSVSPQLLSLKKSRSGRKLLPVLEFWRNQKAVYDKEYKLTCIEFGLSDANLSTDKRRK